MKRLIMLAVLLPMSAMAQPVVDEVDYHYLEMGYLFTDRDVPGGDADGRGPGRFEYSFPIRNHLHLFAGTEAVTYKDIPPDTSGKSRSKTFGFGTHFNLTSSLSVYGRFAYTDLDLNLGAGTVSDDGAVVSGGVRYMPAPGYEIRGGASYRNLDKAGSDTRVFVGGDIFLTDIIAITLDLNVGDDENLLFVGGRFYFGTAGNRPRR
jgi:hypothetical protein